MARFCCRSLRLSSQICPHASSRARQDCLARFAGERALPTRLLRGDLSRALYLNMAALPTVVALVAAALVLAYEALRGRVAVDWNALLSRFRSRLPIIVTLFCVYWLLHLSAALRVPKSELIDLRHPLANEIHKRFSLQTQ